MQVRGHRNSFTTKAVGSADKATQGDAKFCTMNFRNILGTFQPKNPEITVQSLINQNLDLKFYDLINKMLRKSGLIVQTTWPLWSYVVKIKTIMYRPSNR